MDNAEYKDRYGIWGGMPSGSAPDYTRCAEEVFNSHTHLFSQCSRKRGKGKDHAYCWQHAKSETK